MPIALTYRYKLLYNKRRLVSDRRNKIFYFNSIPEIVESIKEAAESRSEGIPLEELDW